jgi:hypothetical protein
MKVKSGRRVAQLSGTLGFTVSEIIRLLAAEWRIEAWRIEDALFRDLAAGVFDPPGESPVIQNGTVVEPSTDFSCCWEIVHEYVDLLGNKQIDLLISINSTSFTLYRQGYRFGVFDDTVFDRTKIPEGAIARFCARWKRPLPAFLRVCPGTSCGVA